MKQKISKRIESIGKHYVSKGEDDIFGDVMPVTLECGHLKLMSYPLHIPVGTFLRCYRCEETK